MRQLLSHSIPCGSDWSQVLEYVLDKVIQQKDKSRELPKRNHSRASKVELKTKATGSLANQGPKETPSVLKGNTAVEIQSHRNFESAQPIKTEQPNIAVRKHIPMSIQRKLFNRDQCCQYRDRTSGKQCRSTWQLTIDHISPIWANGTNELENLRILCAAHNRAIYRQQANRR